MFRKSVAAGLTCAAIVLVGCASPVPRIDVAQEKLAKIKTISVVRVPEPKTYTVLNIGHPGVAFGLIGGLIAAADQNSKQETLSKAYREQGIAINNVLVAELVKQLNAQGFIAQEQDAPWKEVDNSHSLKFEDIQSTADAVLVVSPTIEGFVSPQGSTSYLPTITAPATLLGDDKKNPMYRGFHAVGWRPPAEGWRSTEAKNTYPNFGALMADPKASAQSLEDAARDLAQSVSRDLKRASSSAQN